MVAGACALTALGLAGTAQAATFTVTSADGDASTAGTLRGAIGQAAANPGADEIEFASALAGATIALHTPVVLNDSGTLTVDGSQAPGIAIDGGGTSALLDVVDGDVTLDSLTLAHGRGADGAARTNGVGGNGGDSAIFVETGASLTLRRATLRDSRGGDGGAGSDGAAARTGAGGGGGGGSAVLNAGALTIDSSTLSGDAGGDGGAGGSSVDFNAGGGGAGGGALTNAAGATLSIADSTLSGDVGGDGGDGGATAGESGGGGGGAAGAALIATSGGTAVVRNSTLAGNRAGRGGDGGDSGGVGGTDLAGAGGGAGPGAGGGGGGSYAGAGAAGGSGQTGHGGGGASAGSGPTTASGSGGGGGGAVSAGGSGGPGDGGGGGGGVNFGAGGGGAGDGGVGDGGGGGGGFGGGNGGSADGQPSDPGGAGFGGAGGDYQTAASAGRFGGGGGGGGDFSAVGASGSVGGGAIAGDAGVTSTILAGSVGAADGTPANDCRATIADGAANLVQASEGCTRPAGDALTGDPLLGPLADDGGPTQTLAPALGSPAIDAGANPDQLTSDQRGMPRETVDGGADVGAVELSVPLAISLATPDGGSFDVHVGSATIALSGGTATVPVAPGTPVTLSDTGAGGTVGDDYATTIDCGGGAAADGVLTITPTAATSCAITTALKPVATPTPTPEATPTPTPEPTPTPTASATPAPSPAPSGPAPAPAIEPTLKLELSTGGAQLLSDRRSVSALAGCGPVACSVRLAATVKLPGAKRSWRLTSATRTLAATQVARLRLPTTLALRRAVRAARKRYPGHAITLTVVLSAHTADSTKTTTRSARLGTRALHKR